MKPATNYGGQAGRFTRLWRAHQRFIMIVHVYVLESCKDGRFYIGITKDLKDRLKRHNSGRIQSTKSRLPFKIVYVEEYSDYVKARSREKFLKSGQGRIFLDRFLKS